MCVAVALLSVACRPALPRGEPDVACFPEGYGLTGELSADRVVGLAGAKGPVHLHGGQIQSAGLPRLEELGAEYEETRIWLVEGFSDRAVLAIRLVGAPEHRRGMVWRGNSPIRSNLDWDRFREFLEQDFDGLLATGGPPPDPRTPDGRERHDGAIYDATYVLVERLVGGVYRSKRMDVGDDFSESGRRLFGFLMGLRLQPSCKGGRTSEPVGHPATM